MSSWRLRSAASGCEAASCSHYKEIVGMQLRGRKVSERDRVSSVVSDDSVRANRCHTVQHVVIVSKQAARKLDHVVRVEVSDRLVAEVWREHERIGPSTGFQSVA